MCRSKYIEEEELCIVCYQEEKDYHWILPDCCKEAFKSYNIHCSDCWDKMEDSTKCEFCNNSINSTCDFFSKQYQAAYIEATKKAEKTFKARAANAARYQANAIPRAQAKVLKAQDNLRKARETLEALEAAENN